MNLHVLVKFTEMGPTIYGPFDSAFEASNYHDKKFNQADTVLLMPLIQPEGVSSGNKEGGGDPAQKDLPL
jgi:hypothetical protein